MCAGHVMQVVMVLLLLLKACSRLVAVLRQGDQPTAIPSTSQRPSCKDAAITARA